MNFWTEYIDIVYENLSIKCVTVVKKVHETTKRD